MDLPWRAHDECVLGLGLDRVAGNLYNSGSSLNGYPFPINKGQLIIAEKTQLARLGYR